MPWSRLRTTLRQTVDPLRSSRKATIDMFSPLHASLLAIYMRSSMLSHLGSVGFGCGMVASVRSAQGVSLRPALRVPPLR